MTQQLSPLDALFLSVETNETPSHTGCLAVLDPNTTARFDFEAFRELVAARLPLCPRFKWTVRELPFGLDQPYWVADENFDLDRHMHRVRVPPPGGAQELARVVGALYEGRLERQKPLWEIFFIEGLQGGRFALLWKVHHTLMDGLSASGLFESLFDASPCPEPNERSAVPEQACAHTTPGPMVWGPRAVWNASRRPAALWRHGSNLLSNASSENTQPSRAAAPRTPLNGAVGPSRRVAWAAISFERVQTLKRVLDAKVNDIVLGLTAEAVRRYLLARDALPNASLIASVPVSLRVAGDHSVGNQITDMSVDWGTSVEDPVERIRTIHRSAMRGKRVARKGEASLLHFLAETLTPGALSPMVRVASRFAHRMPLLANAVVSNVPFSSSAIFVAGAKVESLVPISILPPTQGFNITAVTYCGEMHFGITADPQRVDNEWELADELPKALVHLERAAQARGVGCASTGAATSVV